MVEEQQEQQEDENKRISRKMELAVKKSPYIQIYLYWNLGIFWSRPCLKKVVIKLLYYLFIFGTWILEGNFLALWLLTHEYKRLKRFSHSVYCKVWCQTTKPSVIDAIWHHQFLTIKMCFMNCIIICMSWTEINAFKTKQKSCEF